VTPASSALRTSLERRHLAIDTGQPIVRSRSERRTASHRDRHAGSSARVPSRSGWACTAVRFMWCRTLASRRVPNAATTCGPAADASSRRSSSGARTVPRSRSPCASLAAATGLRT
jgi:hypothetical protein